MLLGVEDAGVLKVGGNPVQGGGGKVGGVLTGVSIGAGATFKKYTETFAADSAWVVNHAQNSTVFVAQVFDASGRVIIPDEIETTDANTITVLFNTATAGRVTVIFLE